MKTKYIVIALLLSFSFTVSDIAAQSYKTALGLRFGGLTSGITLKHFTNSNTALEGILSVGRKSVVITGLYEKHVAADKNSSLKFLYGFGAHVGFFQDGGSYYYNDKRTYTSTAVLGIDGILGLDYKFNKAPINISMDIKPFIDFFWWQLRIYGWWHQLAIHFLSIRIGILIDISFRHFPPALQVVFLSSI